MVKLSVVESSNSKIASELPSGLVAVFVGATNGIGEYTLKAFAKYAAKPRVYFVGRSQEAGDRIAAECQKLNSEGEFIFIKADVSLLRNVDDVCRDLKAKESTINILFQSQGTLAPDTKVTSEGIPLPAALFYSSRVRFILNLLPLLRQAPSLRRAVCVGAGGKEGPIDPSNPFAKGKSILQKRQHGAAMLTAAIQRLAATAPEVSFIHDFPGGVKSGIGRDIEGLGMTLFFGFLTFLLPLISVPTAESGERHCFLATSAMYPRAAAAAAAGGKEGADGIPLPPGAAVAAGVDGKPGSGGYAIDLDNESCGPKIATLMGKMKDDGTLDKVWEQTMEEFRKITGTDSV